MRVIRYGKLASVLRCNGIGSSQEHMLDGCTSSSERMHETPYGTLAAEAKQVTRPTLRRYASDPGFAASATSNSLACLTNPLLTAHDGI